MFLLLSDAYVGNFIKKRRGKMDNTLRRLQLTQLEILNQIDGICRKNNIRYSLYGGTLLGAVRHQGFIPWDDDLDVCMPRAEYERFIEIWLKNSPEGYVLQNKENDPCFTQSFTKIRKEHTTFLQFEFEAGKQHTGIFVDIFPIDRIPDSKLKKYWFYVALMLYQLFTREFVPPKGNAVVRKGSEFLLKMIKGNFRKTLRGKLQETLTKYSNDSSLKMVGIETLGVVKQELPKGLFDELDLVHFEGKNFLCFKNKEEYLKIKYGDYMKLPPEEERSWQHHPIILDFEHDYEELKKINREI